MRFLPLRSRVQLQRQLMGLWASSNEQKSPWEAAGLRAVETVNRSNKVAMRFQAEPWASFFSVYTMGSKSSLWLTKYGMPSTLTPNPICDLLEHGGGGVGGMMEQGSYRISVTQGSNGMSRKHSSEDPSMMVQQRPRSGNQTNDSFWIIWHECLHVKMYG